MRPRISPVITRIALRLVLMMAVGAVTTSCGYQLCYDHPHTGQLRVVFDWRDAPGASPQSMSLYLFPTDGDGAGEPLRYEFTDITGGVITVPEGEYRAACLNSDTELILYRNTGSPSTFECYTRTTELMEGYSAYGVRSETVPRAEGTADQPVRLAPDMLWGDSASGIRVEKDRSGTITLYPSESVCTYTVEIRHAENLRYAAALAGSLSSMAGGVLPASGSPTAERITVPFSAVKSDDRTTLHGRFLTFGHPVAEDCTHTLMIYAILSDNAKWCFAYDVTGQIHDAPDPRHVHILLDGLPLPRPMESGGFRPGLDEWQTVRIDITL